MRELGVRKRLPGRLECIRNKHRARSNNRTNRELGVRTKQGGN